MENVLTAFVIVFLLLFAVLTLSHTYISMQETLNVSWQQMQARTDTLSQTTLKPLEAYTFNGGTLVEFALRNEGSTKIANFDQWDVIVQYEDSGDPSTWHLSWYPYAEPIPANNQWTITGLFQDFAQNMSEGIEPGVLNPGEEILIQTRLSPPLQAGSVAQIVVATAGGRSTSSVFAGNYPPQLVTNTGITAATDSLTIIDMAALATADSDDAPEDLVYTVVTPPTQGQLSLDSAFTQTDINDHLLTYQHTGTESDSFTFMVTDGKDTIGEYTFAININAHPHLVNNTGVTLSGMSPKVIDNLYLSVSDVDTSPESLIFTVTLAPEHGYLSLPTTFTQAHINSGMFSYTHTGTYTEADQFQFMVTDGMSSIGPYSFIIFP